MDQGDLGGAPIGERQERRRAEYGQDLRGLCAGPAKPQPTRQPRVQPSRAVRPVDPDFAADAAPGALEQALPQRARRRRQIARERRDHFLEAEVDVDAGAESAKDRSRPAGQVRQALRQVGVALVPVGGAHSLTAPWVSPAMIRR
jgi:hypothetical protein